jgi:hypothetical protein
VFNIILNQNQNTAISYLVDREKWNNATHIWVRKWDLEKESQLGWDEFYPHRPQTQKSLGISYPPRSPVGLKKELQPNAQSSFGFLNPTSRSH